MIKITFELKREIPDQKYINMVDGVGMIKGEKGISKQHINTDEGIQEVTDYLTSICSLFKNQDIWYRINDSQTSWVNRQIGCEEIIEESNPLMGIRGIRRAILFPETFKKEAGMVEHIRAQYPHLHLLIPFVHLPEQMKTIQDYLSEIGYTGKIGMMTELPASIICIDDFLDLGIDYVVVGTNDLHDFTYGLCRKDDSRLRIHRDPTYKAVRRMLEPMLKNKRKNVEYCVGGEIDLKRLLQFVGMGFDNIIVPYKNMAKDSKLQEQLQKFRYQN